MRKPDPYGAGKVMKMVSVYMERSEHHGVLWSSPLVRVGVRRETCVWELVAAAKIPIERRRMRF